LFEDAALKMWAGGIIRSFCRLYIEGQVGVRSVYFYAYVCGVYVILLYNVVHHQNKPILLNSPITLSVLASHPATFPGSEWRCCFSHHKARKGQFESKVTSLSAGFIEMRREIHGFCQSFRRCADNSRQRISLTRETNLSIRQKSTPWKSSRWPWALVHSGKLQSIRRGARKSVSGAVGALKAAIELIRTIAGRSENHIGARVLKIQSSRKTPGSKTLHSPNHTLIQEKVYESIKQRWYPYYSPTDNSLDFDGMVKC